MDRQGLTIHVGVYAEQSLLDRIGSMAPQARVTYQPFTPYEPAVHQEPFLREADVVLGYHAKFGMDLAPKLKWLHLASDGVDHLRGAAIMSSHVQITNTRVFGAPIAEYVFASVLAFYRDFPRMHQRFQTDRIYPTNQWAEYCGDELCGKTMAILGYGQIGRALAQRAHAFEMRVLATRRSISQPEMSGDVTVYPSSRMNEVMSHADVVVVCLPLTDETENLIGEEALASMKRSAYLVAVGRGRVVNEASLVKALRAGWIAGAGLDVYSSYPVPADSPFFDLPNVIMTPHMSGITRNFPPRLADLFCENLRRYLSDEPLLNVVDKRKGY